MNYKALKNNHFKGPEGYEIVVIRPQDIEQIRLWRNGQIDILRQKESIAEEEQINYFKDSIWPTLEQSNPKQILFSFLHRNQCIGYGGLTSINWECQRAEISFLVDSSRNHDAKLYKQDFTHFLSLLCEVAFKDLEFHRLFTETFAFRKEHIRILEDFGVKKEGTLREHAFKRGQFVDSIMHGILSREYLNAK